MSYSWIISFGQIFIYIMFGLVSFMLEQYYKGKADFLLFHHISKLEKEKYLYVPHTLF